MQTNSELHVHGMRHAISMRFDRVKLQDLYHLLYVNQKLFDLLSEILPFVLPKISSRQNNS